MSDNKYFQIAMVGGRGLECLNIIRRERAKPASIEGFKALAGAMKGLIRYRNILASMYDPKDYE